MFSSRLGWSSVSVRHRPLPEAQRTICEIGFQEIDLGALPEVCDHVPSVPDGTAVDQMAADVSASGLHMRSVNGDVGDLNLSIGNGEADFAAGLRSLQRAGYGGHFSLEPETRGVTHEQPPAAAQYNSSLLSKLFTNHHHPTQGAP
ncbi:UNVERIFIED_CONTAM: hypothetical protein RF653_03295 [Kocuria sp. CPCC 205316]|uniref:hypothetical protein n=1 Tax=Kocuria TaxID=57493 RepID=UPI0036D92C01